MSINSVHPKHVAHMKSAAKAVPKKETPEAINFKKDLASGRLKYEAPFFQAKIFGKELFTIGEPHYVYKTDKKQTLGDVKKRFGLPKEYLKNEYLGRNGGGNYDNVDAPDKVDIDVDVMKKAIK